MAIAARRKGGGAQTITGFWVISDNGTETHITGDPEMTNETLEATVEIVQREPDPTAEQGCPFDKSF